MEKIYVVVVDKDDIPKHKSFEEIKYAYKNPYDAKKKMEQIHKRFKNILHGRVDKDGWLIYFETVKGVRYRIRTVEVDLR